MEKIAFFEHTLPALEKALVERGLTAFRAKQLFKWVYGERVLDPQAMTNLPKTLREELPTFMDFRLPQMVDHRISQDGTQKFLFDVGDGRTVESVLIPSGDRLTLCISSEVGCNMACKFCYTAKQKLVRRLSIGEIVGQYYVVVGALSAEQRVSNVVFMGMGEPLDNCENVFPAIETMHSPFGFNLSRKKITVSTSGLVPQIPLVTQAKVRLAVSLNAPNDEIRSKIMPINRRYPIKELLAACMDYCNETGDRVTLEYVLLKGLTDSLDNADELFHLTKNIPCKINIIPFNEHPNSGFERPAEIQIDRFQQRLIHLGAHVLRRKTMGRDIYAACGQLTSAYKGRPEVMIAP